MDIQHCKKIFDHYSGMMRTKELKQEKYSKYREKGTKMEKVEEEI